MIRLRTLGSADLRAPNGTQLQAVLRQPKRLAVLVYLALSGPAFQRRDRLLALFWPESDEDRARGALSQAVFQLRQALGREVIVNRGDDEIGVAAESLWCDAAEFKRFVAAGKWADAMMLYDGELLPGFLIDDADEFVAWLDEERGRLAAQAARASMELAAAADAAGDLPIAIRWARRAVAIQPLNEPSHQKLIELLDRSGDRAAALQAFEELRARLRSEFDAEPSAETLDLIQTVRSRAEAKGPGWSRPSAGVAGSAVTEVVRRRTGRRRASAIAAGILVTAAVVATAVTVGRTPAYKPPADHIAVLYFNDESEKGELGYLAEGLTSTLIDELGQVRKLQVISQNGVRPFRGQAIGLDSIARQLDVGTIVGGSVARSNDRVRVTVELTDGATGLIVRSKQLERPVGELFALLDDVSQEVALFLRSSLGEEIRLRERQAETRNVEAWELYQRAENVRAAADSLERRGDLPGLVRELERADSMLERAAQLDRKWGAPLVLRGRIAERRGYMSLLLDRPPRSNEWFATAREYAERSIELDKQNAAAFELRALSEYGQWTIATAFQGTSPDSLLVGAERDLKTALALEPDLPRAESYLSAVLFVQGRFAEARQRARRALEADAYLTNANEIANRLFATSFEVGDDADAGHWCDEIRRRQPNEWPSAYCDLVLLGWSSTGSPDPRKALLLLDNFGREEPPELRDAMRPQLQILTAAVLARAERPDSARALLARARSLSPNNPELLWLEAAVRVLLSEHGRAVELLEEYFRGNPSAKPRIANGRMFRPLRDDPDFRAVAGNQATGRPQRR